MHAYNVSYEIGRHALVYRGYSSGRRILYRLHGIIGEMEAADNDLLNDLQRGDDHAIEELLQRYQSKIYRYGMKMCRDPEDAKDVLQDTLLTMARSLRSFRGASSLSTWLYTIARSFCIKKLRKSKFAPAEELSLSGVDSDHSGPASPHRNSRTISFLQRNWEPI